MRAWLELCLRRRRWVIGASVILVVLGLRALEGARFDAFPEFAPPRVEIQTEAPGLSSEEVERLVTTPIESALAGLPRATALRSRSVLGLSSIVILLPLGTELTAVRTEVQERLSRIAPRLPSVARPPVMLSPLSSTSRVLKIGCSSPTLTQLELTDLARWWIRPTLMSVPGVANVAIWGERDRRLEVRVDPERLAAHRVDLGRVTTVVRDAVAPRAGGFVDGPTTRIPVLHAPVVHDVAGLRALPLSMGGRAALAIGDVADVVEDHGAPIGEGLVTSGTGLLLIVEKQPGANTLEVTRGIDRALERLRPRLGDVELDATIFRPARFIERAIHNLGEAMAIGCAFVIVVLLAFLWNARTALISVLAIPLSLIAAVATLTALGQSIDTMVIAGLVIALGEVVDDAIIDVENIHRRLGELRVDGRVLAPREVLRVVLDASLEVRSAIVYASLVVLLVFVPVLFLDGVPGAFFRPLAIAYGLAVLASTLVAITITPVLAMTLLGRGDQAHEAPFASWLRARYEPVLRAALARPKLVVAATVASLALALGLSTTLREGFLPHFVETDLLMHWVLRPGTSLEAVRRSADRARAELLTVPGVRNFGAHIGRAEVADEVVGPNFAELWISIDPEAEVEATIARVRAVVDGYPGIYRDVQTYLQERMREVLSGGSGAVVVRLRGDELEALRGTARELAADLDTIPGIAHARPEAQVLVPELEVEVDLARATALGVDPGLVRTRVSTLIGGETVGQIVRGVQPIDVVVWSSLDARRDAADLADLMISLDATTSVRLGDVATVRTAPMPNTITHDATRRKLDVVIDLDANADLASVGREVAARVAATSMPVGIDVEILGEGAARAAARTRLLVLSALALAGIWLVLLADFGSVRLAAVVFAGLPFAWVGAILAATFDGVVSIGTLVGAIAVIGIAARNGIMLVAHCRAVDDGTTSITELVVSAAKERLSPILMTALATGLALVPVAWSGPTAGREIEYPMSLVIIGGLASSTLLTLFVTPVLYAWFGRSPASSSEEAME